MWRLALGMMLLNCVTSAVHDKLGAWVKMSILNGQVTGKRARTVDFWIKVTEACLSYIHIFNLIVLNDNVEHLITSRPWVQSSLRCPVLLSRDCSWGWAHTSRKSVLDGLLQHSEPTGGLVWVIGRLLGWWWETWSIEGGWIWRVIVIVERIRREEVLMTVVAEREIGFGGI